MSFVGDGDGDVDVDDNEFEEEDADEVELGVVARELGEVSRGMDETAVFGDDDMLDEDELGEGVIDENVLDCWDVCELGVHQPLVEPLGSPRYKNQCSYPYNCPRVPV